ncbi:MAG: polysaccharide biosynthesis/export family protein [Bacteroidia bacterium]|nr:polysaccharide biosynthesis/export family protein [Bacteroidia bacterium]
MIQTNKKEKLITANKIVKLILTLLTFTVFQGCISNKNYVLLQKKTISSNNDSTEVKIVNSEYKLKTGDILYIRLLTDDEKTNQILNPLSGGNMNMQMLMSQAGTGTPFYILGYTVNSKGNLELPFLGEIHAEGKSIEELKVTIGKEAEKYFKKFYLQIKLGEFRFSVIGSVYRPGQYFYMVNHLNILEALAMAGDVTEIAKRNGLTLIREENGLTKLVQLDLTDRNIINSPYFYIKPNDILYVQPVKSRSIGKITNFQETLGTVLPIFSTFLLVLNTYIILQNIK